MKKIKFTISGEFSPEDVLTYAKARGYVDFVEGIDEEGNAIIKANPEKPDAFVSQFIKNLLVREVGGVSEANIRAEHEAQLLARLGGLHNSISGSISVKASEG